MFDAMKKSMEKTLEKKKLSTKSFIAIIMFGAIIIVFALFGLQTRNSMGGGDGAAATVNSSRISIADLRSEAQRLEQMYAPMFGGNLGNETQRQYIRSMALENLITNEVIKQSAEKEGVYATDAEVRDFIVKEIPAFHKDGKFKKDIYIQVLEANRMTPGEFEDKVRKDRMNQRSRHLLEVVALPLTIEEEKNKELKENKLNISFIKLDKEIVEKKMKIPPNVIKEELAKVEFKKKVEDYFNSHKAEFSTEAEVKAQHILIKVDAAQPDSDKKALEKINEIKKKISKEDFGKLAKEFSEDTGSKIKNGDLGWFGKGRMVPEFELAAFSQKIGVVGEPVKSSFGYHLIKVNEKKEAKKSELVEVEEKIADKLLAGLKYDEEMKKMEDLLSKKDSDGLNALLNNLSLTWDESGFFEMGADSVPKINSQVVSEAVFELSETQPLLNRVVRDGGQKFILKLKDTKKETVSDVNGKSSLARERSNDLFGQWISFSKKMANIERNQQLLAK